MYRAQQFFRAVGARMGPAAWAEVEALLTPPQVALLLWHRVAIVLLRAFVPRWMAWLTRKAEPGHWRYPFYAHRMHAEIGARWAEEAGCSSLAVWLIANHQSFVDQGTSGREDSRVRLLAALRWADDQN
jgi:hypothetical protein